MKRHRWVRPKDKKVEKVEVPFTAVGYLISDTGKCPIKPIKFMTIDEFIKESED